MVTSWFLCKMLLFRQCSPSDVVLMTSLMTSSRNNLCRKFGANYLRNEARWRNGSNGQPIEKCPWTIVWECSRSRHVTQWRHSVGDVMIFFCKVLLLRRCSPIGMSCPHNSLSDLMTSLQRANLIAYWLNVIEYSSTSSNFGLSGVATS